MQSLQNVLHSLAKRKKQAGKVPATAAAVAVFIAVLVVSADGISGYQKAVTKKTFGGWFIMENSSVGTKSEELKNHPYLTRSGTAVNTAVYTDSVLSSTDIKIGYMDSEAVQLSSLTLMKGEMPHSKDEIAVQRWKRSDIPKNSDRQSPFSIRIKIIRRAFMRSRWSLGNIS